MVFWIIFLTSRTKLSTPLNINTLPAIPSQVKKLPQDIKVSDIVPVANTTPFGNGYYSIENQNLVFTLPDDSKSIINTQNQPVIDFTINNSSIVITTGEIYSNKNNYFLHDINTNNTVLINITKAEPIVSISSAPDTSSVAILGNLNSADYTMSLYLYNPQSSQKNLIATNLSRNFVHYPNNNLLLLGKEIDKTEPNFYFDLYDTSTSSYLSKEVLSSKKTVCSNQTSTFYLDFKDKTVKEINFKTKKTVATNIKIETDLPQFFCNESNLFTVINKNNVIKTQKIDLTNTSEKTEKEINLKEKQILIQSFLQNNVFIFKIYDYTNKTFSFVKDK